MRYIDLIRRASRSLKSAKLRTLLTSLAIAVGGFTLTLTLAGSNGARQYADKLVASNFDPSELLVGRDAEIANDGAPSGKPQEYDDTITSITGGGNSSIQFKRITRADIDKIKKLPFVEQVRENYQITTQYISREGQKKYTVSTEAYNPAQKPELAYGKLPATGDIATGEVLIPDAYLTLLGFTDAQDAIGRQVSIVVRKPFTKELAEQIIASGGAAPTNLTSTTQAVIGTDTDTRVLKVAGVTKKSATSFNFGASPILISPTDARSLYEFTAKGTPDYDKFLYAYVRVVDGKKSNAIASAERELGKAGFYTQSVKDIQKSLLQIVNILQTVVMVFGFITLIASVFGIVNTQYISVLERTREIGLMKALGMRKKDISRLFTLEAVWIGFLGGTIGSLLALALGMLFNPKLSDVIGFDKGTYILIFKPLQILLLVLGLMLVAMLAGLLPARKAAKLDPIEALRTE